MCIVFLFLNFSFSKGLTVVHKYVQENDEPENAYEAQIRKRHFLNSPIYINGKANIRMQQERREKDAASTGPDMSSA